MEMSDSDGSALNCECVATTSDAASQTTNHLAGRLSVATWLLHTWRYAFARTATTALGGVSLGLERLSVARNRTTGLN